MLHISLKRGSGGPAKYRIVRLVTPEIRHAIAAMKTRKEGKLPSNKKSPVW
jgi:hypothetical protein